MSVQIEQPRQQGGVGKFQHIPRNVAGRSLNAVALSRPQYAASAESDGHAFLRLAGDAVDELAWQDDG